MCGRFTLVDLAEFTDLFPWIKGPGVISPRYNIAPTQPILAAVCEKGECRLEELLWGLVPHWAKDRTGGAKMINARCESAAERPAFRDAVRDRRAIVPASGFYEWKREGSRGGKQPYYITRRDGKPMLFAALWDCWRDPAGQGTLRTCAILTTASTPPIAGLHDRMPVILEPPAAERWLKAPGGQLDLATLLSPSASQDLSLTPVSMRVNVATTEGADLIEPLKSHLPGSLFD